MLELFNALKRIFDYAVGKKYKNQCLLRDWKLDLLKTSKPGVIDFMNVMYSHGCFSLTTRPT